MCHELSSRSDVFDLITVAILARIADTRQPVGQNASIITN
jgi:hypothetical protein